MKYLKLLLICLLVACSPEPEVPRSVTQGKNETSIPDSAYYFFDLDHLDTVNGFQEFFEDTSNVAMVKYYYDEVINSELTSDDDVLGRLFNAFWLRASVIDLVYHRLILSQKEESLRMGIHTGTMNSACLRLRPKNEFDIHWTGWGGSSELYQGYYRQSADTLYFSFTTKRPERVRDTMLIQEDRIAPIDIDNFSLVHFFFEE
ncbi:MAG: hypothetical protein Crog4KO_24620 [Crocinitomicaceae bacterium]